MRRMPAEPLTAARAATIRAHYAPGDYWVRRDRTDGLAYYSGRCAGCLAPIGETDCSVFDLGGSLICAKPACYTAARDRRTTGDLG